MKDEKYFVLESLPWEDQHKHYTITPNFDLLPVYKVPDGGSYNVLQARLLGLDWPNFLRFCRDYLGADVVGKGHLYPAIYFDNTEKVRQYVRLLNKTASYAMAERELPTEELKAKIEAAKN